MGTIEEAAVCFNNYSCNPEYTKRQDVTTELPVSHTVFIVLAGVSEFFL